MVTLKDMKYNNTLKVIQVNGRCPSKAAKGAALYSERIKAKAREKIKIPFKTDVGVILDLFYEGSKTRPDIDNVEKLILDSLKGTAFQDDKQVVESEKKLHDTTTIMEFENQPIFLIDPLMEGISEYCVIRIHEKRQ